MKNIKRKIFQIILTVFMVFSSCFLTGTVEAVDDTGSASTTSSGYFEKNIYAENTEVLGGDKGEKPNFIPSSSNKGSDINFEEGETEGQVWINKKVEVIDSNTGIFKITFQALGFKYRNVNDQNEKEDVWKNPLKAETSLEISEQIDENFYLIRDDANYEMSISDSIVGLKKNAIQFNESETEPDTVVMKFDANDVTCSSNEGDGVAFDVEASFYVQVNSDVDAGTYDTEDAKSTFEPATDNFYYYKWGQTETTTTYSLKGYKWNAGSGIGGIQFMNNITVPDINNEKFSFSVCSDNQQQFAEPNEYKVIADGKFSSGADSYPVNTPDKDRDDYTWIDIKNNLDEYNWEEKGIENLYFYFITIGNGNNAEAYLRIEIQYTNGRWNIYTPSGNLGSTGGNNPDGKIVLKETVIVDKGNPIWRDTDDTTPGIVEETFKNKGQIRLVGITKEDIQQEKTAHVIDWDERTYKIDLYAAHKINNMVEPIDLVMMLDFSGSMPWFVNQPTGKVYKKNSDDLYEFKETEILEKNNNQGTIQEWNYSLYVKDVVDEGSQSEGTEDTYEYKPIVWCDEGEYLTGENKHELKSGWYIVKSRSDGVKVIDAVKGDNDDDPWESTINWELNNNNIYSRGNEDKTKLEALESAISAFVNDLEDLSPNSRIAIIPFAGGIISDENAPSTLSNVSTININALFNSVDLHGGTNQKVAMEKANELLKNNTTSNKEYAILFSDGAPSYGKYGLNIDNCNQAAENLETQCSLFFTAGIFADDTQSKGTAEMKRWSSDNCVYIRDNSNDLQEAFKDIFGRITIQITGVTVVDYIDKRFIITDEDGNPLNNGDKFAGGIVNCDENSQWYIQWDDVNLSYAEDITTGWHKTIFVKAKEEYIGGNNVTTNGTGSGIDVGDIHVEFDQPKVNVKVDYVVGNHDEKVFLGESVNLESNAQTKLFDISNIYNSKETKLTMDPDGNPFDKNDFAFEWYSSAASDMSTVTGEKLTNLTINPTDKEVYYLKVILNVKDSENEALENTDNNRNTLDNTLIAKNDIDSRKDDSVKLDDGNNIGDFATSNSKYGVYIVDVVSGSITINKNIFGNDIANSDTQGDSIFTFLIEGTTVSGKNIHEYKVLRFSNNDVTTQSFTISGLEKGTYTITELDTIRYNLDSINTNNSNCPVKVDSGEKTVEFKIGYKDSSNQTDLEAIKGEATYTNKLVNNENYGDTDYVKNKFSVDANGKVTITPSHETEDQSHN